MGLACGVSSVDYRTGKVASGFAFSHCLSGWVLRILHTEQVSVDLRYTILYYTTLYYYYTILAIVISISLSIDLTAVVGFGVLLGSRRGEEEDDRWI